VLAALLLVLPDRYRVGIASGVRSTVLLPFIAMERGAVDHDGQFADASEVRAERDSLAAFLVGQASLVSENRQLRGLLGMRQRLPYSFVAAEVVRPGGSAEQGSFLVTGGARDGVHAGSPVVTSRGLVGMIKEVYGQDAVGYDWTNPNFRASAVSVDGQTYGIVEPHAGPGGDRMLALTSTALHTVPKKGTLIVTSGSGGTYPRGIPIGEVVGTESEASTWQRIYLIRPLVSPDEMSHVLVLGAPQSTTTVQDLAGAWGIRLRQGPPPDSLMLPRAAPAAAPAAPVERPAPRRTPRPSGPRLLGRPVIRQDQNTQGTQGTPQAGTPVPPQPGTPPDTGRRRQR